MCRGWVAAACRGSPELGTGVTVFVIQGGCGVSARGGCCGARRAGGVLSCERGRVECPQLRRCPVCRGWVAAARRGSPELGTVVAVFVIQDGCGVSGTGRVLWRTARRVRPEL